MIHKNINLSINIVFLAFGIILMFSKEQFLFIEHVVAIPLGIGFFTCSILNLLFTLSIKQPKKD
jgi:hypothetical protein